MINTITPKVATTETPKQGVQVAAPSKSAKSDSVNAYQDVKSTTEQVGQIPSEQKDVQSVDQAELDQAVKQINDFVQDIQRNIEFSVDDDTGRTVIKVYDSSSEELIRQIPNEEVLELAKNLKNSNGLLFNAKA